MRRREFITLLGSAAAWPLAARAQQPAMPVIGFLGSASSDLWANYVRAFQQGLGETGYFEDRNVAIEYRWTEGQNERMSGLIADLLHRPVNVIAVPGSTPAALAAKGASTTVPIVFAIAADPVQLLVNSANPALAEPVSQHVHAAARTLGVKLDVLHASSEPELKAALATAARLQTAGHVVGPDPFFNSRIEQVAELTSRQALPAVYQWREFTAAGGLLSYGSSITDVYRQAGVYTGRILKGEKPADLPVEQTTKVELFINLKAAHALGVTVPTALLVRADEVIE